MTESAKSQNSVPFETSIATCEASLESILCTEELYRRPSRTPDHDKKNRALVARMSPLADSPTTILQTLAETILEITQSDSAGLSLMTMGQVAASIAHEVNQPLSGIITNASTCLRMLDADPPNLEGARETARRTIRDGHRAAEVITRLRALFSKKSTAFESFDLNDAAKEAIALSTSELQRNRVILQMDLASGLPSVLGDRIQIQQVILNLIRNGADAMSTVADRPRELLIKTERDESGGVRLSVRDTGVGFDPKVEEKLFEAFYTTKSDGMGIGLCVSRSIMESHQGRLWAIQNEGQGATFIFSIPGGTNT